MITVAFDPNQRFVGFVPGGNGILYAIQADGALYWYRHLGWQTGSASWANGGNGVKIGADWHQFTNVLAAADGELFAFHADGSLSWYRYILTNSSTGAGYWASGSGSVIGTGFNRYQRIFGGFDNVLYCEDADGNLFWYKYLAANGSAGWANGGNGLQIGAGWKPFVQVWADSSGVVFGVYQTGDLYWWRRIVQNTSTGAGYWVNGGNAILVGNGWGSDTQRAAWSNTSGVVYAIDLDTSTTPATDNTLFWYRLQNSQSINTAGVSWANSGSGIQVGSGFTMEPTAALQAYPSAQSTPQGGSVGINVSTTFSNYTSTIVRVAPAASSPVTVVSSTSHTGRFQPLQSGYRSAGCGWSADFNVSVPSTWQSGVYAAQLRSPQGVPFDAVFCVRPAAPQHQIAVVVPTNTYNAYNTWGGHDQYTSGQDGVQRTITMLRPNLSTALSGGGVINHTLYSDLFLLRWMTSQNIAYDCYTDLDVDGTGPLWLSQYKGVVLLSHPEYWTDQARTNLIDYLDGGGRVIYTGGNGIYERIQYSADRTAAIFRTPTGDRDVFDDAGEPTADVLGIDFNAASYMDFYPYQVNVSHPWLSGTGLGPGDTFGAAAYNGPGASGWEVDSYAGTTPGTIVIASGQNPNGGADLCQVPKPNNGWVFTAGSISFNGSIPYDAAVRQILSNVFAAAVA
jgi:hypothetical protein